MNAEIKALWIEALRSGNYPQGVAALKLTTLGENPRTQYCCLGVLCDIYAQRTGLGEWNHSHPAEFQCMTGMNLPLESDDDDVTVSASVLPVPVMEWAGLEDLDPTILVNGVTSTLAKCNDGIRLANNQWEGGMSFAEIATLIEENL